MANRKKVETEWLKFLDEVKAPVRNKELYKELFARLTDEEFDAMMQLIRDEKDVLAIRSFNMEGEGMDYEHVMKVGEKLGISWFQRIEMTDSVTRETSLSPVRYLILELQVRRQIQHLVKKRSTASSNKVVDQLSGQVTGDSKSASMSLPELTALNAKGNAQGIIELIKVRGGDKEAYRSMMEQIRDTGGFSLGPIIDANSRPKIISTTNKLLRGMGLSSTL
ncbi:hypothetical protein [Vibrio phage vB_VmeM-Yong XC32]|nr:hypothetical protein [Vibrio phage vB_VmeM-Yong XC31]QAX96461.1 hypothetical protein [Vibrio phage vB_VmeM-Yong XC32]QAX96778.1 hypothetical protein [Vibrio phage vB_VmeM-Yong MS31]QAX97097.1 hypothetical protein [Vibrio phage vB_VmeM-Yong MS32]